MSIPISVTILTKNSQKHLFACLSALQDFAEIVVLDNGSTDNSIRIAQKFPNVRVIESPFIGFGPLKNLAAEQATNSWILSIDSDEVITDELKEELLRLEPADPQVAYSIRRNNYYRDKLIKACGWDKDYVLRLYHKGATGFADLQVHEYVRTEGMRLQRLTGTLQHYSYDSISQLISKSDKYTSLFAAENRFRKRSSPFKSFYKGAFSFFRNYFLQRGLLYGYEGLTISFTNAANSFYKYMKLYEANHVLHISMIVLNEKGETDGLVLRPALSRQKVAPEEIIVAQAGIVAEESTVKIANAYVPVYHKILPINQTYVQELQEVVGQTSGEYLIILGSGSSINHASALLPNFIYEYKNKAQRGAFSYLKASHTSPASIGFWKTDFQNLSLAGNDSPAGATNCETLAAWLSANGLKQVDL